MMYVGTYYVTCSNVVVSDLRGLLHTVERDPGSGKGVVY